MVLGGAMGGVSRNEEGTAGRVKREEGVGRKEN